MTAECACCGRPTPDGYACHEDALRLSQTLRTAAGHAEDAEAVLSRQTRYGTGSRGGYDEPLPLDLTAATRYGEIVAVFRRWTNTIGRDTGRQPRWRRAEGPPCPTGQRCDHDSCAAIRRRIPGPALSLQAAWLAQHTQQLRQHPTAITELDDACTQLARLVDRPADKELVGVCDCGKVLYAPKGRGTVRCPQPTCELTWDVEQSRDVLRRHLGDKLVTAAEAARLSAYLDSDRTQEQIRKLINKWAERTLIEAHGRIDGELAYRFADIASRLASTPRRAAPVVARG